MRHKRAKTYKRAISIYTTAFGFRTPFQVLVSNDILLALNRESDIFKQLAACCQGDIKPMITQCCVEALYALGKESQAVVNIAKMFERRRCNHRTAISPDDCLKDVVGETNKHRYVLSAQSQALRNAVANVPGLPIIHFNARGVLVLSPPSRATLKHKDAQEEARRLEGADVVDDIEDGENVVGAGTATEPVKRARAKGPNPLSMKKKKTAETGSKREEKVEEVEQAKKKKNRKRGKGLVKQVKEEIEAERAAEAARGGASGASEDGDAVAQGDSGMESD